ncbi:MAG: tRNA lysidine(34) synthetase TilS [Desulfuromonas sp.]|nr:MAG: tRNA lysidine(34) synthetase TilS [Desulfuromonas sp.]
MSKKKSLLNTLKENLPAATTCVLAAVSGGVDSVVLLHLLKQIAPEFGLHIEVAHLDHQLRPESRRDAEFVACLCADLEIPCHFRSFDVAGMALKEGVSLEMAGRAGRREFLLEIAEQIGADVIALGHHRDDQVETFLLRLLRGSGISGLACMRSYLPPWWRPLLDHGRSEILAYAKAAGLRWVEDASNADPVFLRNRLRGQILPQFHDINPLFSENLAALTRRIQLEEDFWQEQVGQLLDSLVVAGDDGLRLCREQLLRLHQAQRLRLYREALRRVRGDLGRIEAVHLEAIDELLLGDRSQAQVDLPEAWVARRYQALWFREARPLSNPSLTHELVLPGELTLPGGRLLRAEITSAACGESQSVVEFDLDQLQQPLLLRNYQPGDRFAPLGMIGHKKLKKYFSDNRIEFEVRRRALVLVGGEEILWVLGMRRSRLAPVTGKSRQVLRLSLV